MRWFLLLTLYFSTTVHAVPTFGNGANFTHESLQVTLTHYEAAKRQPILFVHFEVKNPESEPKICAWKELVTLVRADGSRLTSNYDALVDLGTGATRTVGPFTLAARRKAKVAVPFLLAPDDLPANLELPDGRQSPIIPARRPPR